MGNPRYSMSWDAIVAAAAVLINLSNLSNKYFTGTGAKWHDVMGNNRLDKWKLPHKSYLTILFEAISKEMLLPMRGIFKVWTALFGVDSIESA